VKSKQFKTDFLFGFRHFLIWISPIFGFPGFSKESGKSQLENSEIQTMEEIQTKEQCFYSLDFPDFMFGFPGFKFGFRSFLYLDFAN
jgi:hypothetical protein